MSGSQYPTLSLSLYFYLLLLSTLEMAQNSDTAEDSPCLLASIQVAKQKLTKFFDKSMAESEFYYFATSASK
jgi:hypothetical protein